MNKHMNYRFAAALAVSIGTLAGSMELKAAPFELEAAISSIDQRLDGRYQVVCGNVPVVISGTTAISSPTKALTVSELIDSTSFPNSGVNPVTGEQKVGFRGGTCIAIGDTDTEPGLYVADSLFVEIAENVVIGLTTGNGSVNGIPIIELTDPRMSALKPAAGFYNADGTHPLGEFQESITSDTGFGIELSSVPANLPAAAAGYIGTDAALYAFSVEITGAAGAYKFLEPRPSILRAQCRVQGRSRDELQVRGGCIMPADVDSIEVSVSYQTAPGTDPIPAGTVDCVPEGVIDLATGTQEGVYRFREREFDFNGSCPIAVRASTSVNGETRYHWFQQ